MDLGLKGRRALVMGASKGLGRSVADALAEEGVALAISGRNQDSLDRAAGELQALGAPKAIGIVADVAEGTQMDRLADAAVAALGGVDILVLNHGGPPTCTALEMKQEDLVTWFQRIVLSPIRIANRLLPAMQQQKWGRLITIASTGVAQPLPGLALSNTLRSAIVGWNKTLASEVAGDGITCNIIGPGAFNTDRTKETLAAVSQKSGKSIEALVAERSATIPVGRYGEPREFGPMGAFLASDKAAYTTGRVHLIDGGVVRGV
ncbi:SDR family oxidoreductase [Teichococcus vastitatis]|jgi:3-oxoacyl-[acyl-carrier protein] reductase|uniref:SDR family oxidoreductase n=1 Tax=Teichococcus vastitatis TaxID=2307076 RepID=A0ABS9W1U7_9PROT|nr:SDR family oxidoreductase [Pseudoroseomonas vastitatis]MCI0753023.1 SDR family oxidoreductase [Pseudoroseomonas vastitatis]